MNTKKKILFALGLVSSSYLSAQFSSGGLSEAGSTSKDLTTDPNWSGAPDTFIIDESGMTLIQPTLPFRLLRYVGDGGVYSQESLKVSLTFQLNFEEGENAEVRGGSMAAGFVQFENLSDIQEAVGASLRRVSGADPGMFNIFVINTFNGSKIAEFTPRFDASELGLAYDGDNNWTDGVSDPLELLFELKYEDGAWIQSASLTNLETSDQLSFATLRTIDEDNSFLENSKGFRINTDKIDQNPVTVSITNLDVAAE